MTGLRVLVRGLEIVEGRAKPILFSSPMVRAILREIAEPSTGKTQTRRILRPQPQEDIGLWLAENRVPYAVGDRLWVREALGRRTASFLGIEATNGAEEAFYLADDEDVLESVGFNVHPWWQGTKLSPMCLPRWASRITLAVTDVRIQRLQDISEADAEAEGAECTTCANVVSPKDGFPSYVSGFGLVWEAIHGPGAWEVNPWVLAVTFTPTLSTIDATPKTEPAREER